MHYVNNKEQRAGLFHHQTNLQKVSFKLKHLPTIEGILHVIVQQYYAQYGGQMEGMFYYS